MVSLKDQVAGQRELDVWIPTTVIYHRRFGAHKDKAWWQNLQVEPGGKEESSCKLNGSHFLRLTGTVLGNLPQPPRGPGIV